MNERSAKRVLGLDPFSRGVGFAVLEGADNLVDFGLKSTGHASNKKAIRAIQSLIVRFQPDLLAVEDWNSTGSRRCRRVRKLLERVVARETSRIRVQVVNRRQLESLGPISQTCTKYARAQFYTRGFPELRPHLPPVRRPWMPEDDRSTVFDALGFALACFRTQTAPAGPADEIQV